jgi:hypothetical protein
MKFKAYCEMLDSDKDGLIRYKDIEPFLFPESASKGPNEQEVCNLGQILHCRDRY